jgi:hypothetical protein
VWATELRGRAAAGELCPGRCNHVVERAAEHTTVVVHLGLGVGECVGGVEVKKL